MAYCSVIAAVADAAWPVLPTSVVGVRDGASATGPNGRLVTDSEKPSLSVNETRTSISFPVSASTSWYLAESAPTSVSVSPSTRIHW